MQFAQKDEFGRKVFPKGSTPRPPDKPKPPPPPSKSNTLPRIRFKPPPPGINGRGLRRRKRRKSYDTDYAASEIQQYEESTMTTEEALAVADSVQFGITSKPGDKLKGSPSRPPPPKAPPKPPPMPQPTNANKQQEPSRAPPYNPVTQTRKTRRTSGKRKGDYGNITIHNHGHVQLSDADQFVEATKGRLDAAERQAMRRAIAQANIHPAVKVALLRHSAAVQFSDSGEEYPSVPMSWVLRAAKGILQMAIVPQTMDQMNQGMREKVLDSLYSGDNNALDAVAELLEKHGLHDELIAMLHGGHDYGEPRPEDVVDQEKQIAVNEMHDR